MSKRTGRKSISTLFSKFKSLPRNSRRTLSHKLNGRLFLNSLKSNILKLLPGSGDNHRLPTLHQWKKFFKVLTKTEKNILFLFLIIFVLSTIAPLRNFYLNNTQIVPGRGGAYVEAMVGTPRYLNPVLAAANDVDRDISSILYSSLIKRSGSGEIISDLAENYSINEDFRAYEFTLKSGVKWHDGKELTADDVIFTVQLIQNPDYKSPLRASLQGVDVEKTSDLSVRFTLRNPYSPFLDNLNFGILPRHIWENVSPSNFPLTELNLRPIGSGPYKFQQIQKDGAGKINNIEIVAFDDYFQGEPFIQKIVFRFYKDEEETIAAFSKGNVDGISFVSANNTDGLSNEYVLNNFALPRYFAVFFNQTESKALAEKPVREALSYATNKTRIIEEAVAGQAIGTESPVPQLQFNKTQKQIAESQKYPFDSEKAKEILQANKWEFPAIETESGTTTQETRAKTIDNETVPLEISLLTVNWPELIGVANRLKSDWEAIGIRVNLDVKTTADIQERIRGRQYQALLFGQILSPDPDPFSFWHSSQKKDPGLNLAIYDNKDADKLLESIRQEFDQDKKNQLFDQFEELVVNDSPAVFLYSPTYIFPTKPVIKGIEVTNGNLPSARFAEISRWYIKTRRAWK